MSEGGDTLVGVFIDVRLLGGAGKFDELNCTVSELARHDGTVGAVGRREKRGGRTFVEDRPSVLELG